MVEFNKSQTKANLARSFAGECQEGARYQFIAMMAMNEEMQYIQTLMKQIAKHEMSHAKVFYDLILKHVGSGMDNIDISAGYPFPAPELKTAFKKAATAELGAAKNIYPSFAKIAQDEGYKDVADAFLRIASVELCHYKLLSEVDEKYNKNKLYKEDKAVKWKCSQCGYEHTAKTPWKECPLCGYSQGYTQFPLSDN